jgi:Carboxypeptidase regulatory-like domain
VADQIPETEVPSAAPAPAAEGGIVAWLRHPYLPHAQAVVGLLAGILSIGGFAYSYFWATTPVPPTRGDVVAVALDARTEKPIPDATLEILTVQDALVTTLTPDSSGRARQVIKEGNYRLRASHARYTTEVRQIHVIGGNTSELRVRLTPRAAKASSTPAASTTPPTGAAGKNPSGSAPPASSGSEVGKVVDEGVNAVKKIFR